MKAASYTANHCCGCSLKRGLSRRASGNDDRPEIGIALGLGRLAGVFALFCAHEPVTLPTIPRHFGLAVPFRWPDSTGPAVPTLRLRSICGTDSISSMRSYVLFLPGRVKFFRQSAPPIRLCPFVVRFRVASAGHALSVGKVLTPNRAAAPQHLAMFAPFLRRPFLSPK